MFKNRKMRSLITDSGREDTEFLLITNNNIQAISKNELISLKNNSPDLKDRTVIIPLYMGKMTEQQKKELDAQKTSGKKIKKKMPKGCAAASVIGSVVYVVVLIVALLAR